MSVVEVPQYHRPMHDLILWCGFLGAWLLVAGPVYQAVLELQAEEFETERLRTMANAVPSPEPISPWWWLLPPARYVLKRRRQNEYQMRVLASMNDEDYTAFTSYVNKAVAWIFVGTGGFLIAANETYYLVTGLHWPIAILGVLIVVMSALAAANAFARQSYNARERARRHQN